MRTALMSLSFVFLVGCTGFGQRPATVPSTIVEPNPLLGRTIGLDHVLLWARNREAGESFLRDRLGFTLGPAGSYTHGIRHNIIRFPNSSFIEFLWLSDPASAREHAPWAYDFASKHNGSNAFGIQVESIDATYKRLSDGGLRPEQPMAEALDPDGPEGPKPPIVNEWRFMFLGEGAAPGEPFFVQYKPKEARASPPLHRNGAVQLSSVWVAVANLQAARDAYLRAGFRSARQVSMPKLGASGFALAAGDGEIILLTPSGEGPLAKRLSQRGDHVVGMGVRVGNAKTTLAVLKSRLGHQHFRDVRERSILVDATGELGVFLDFHE